MNERVLHLISNMIETERSRSSLPAGKALAAVRDQFTGGGALGHGRYPLLLDEASATEYDRRANAWLGIARRVVAELEIEWTADRARGIQGQLRVELARDWDDIYARMEGFAKGSRGMRIELLEAAKDRAARHMEHEFELLVLKADHTRLPVMERLAADRYRAVATAWTKANTLIDAPTPDLANAVKEAVGAVEALARIVIGIPSATLGDAIKVLRAKDRIRAPLLKGIEELWAWSSGEPGVRHAASEGPLAIADVRYCVKLAEAGLELLLATDAT